MTQETGTGTGTVYAIASGKGGVGKTTTTVNLGAALADAGERVVIVDVDLGMANIVGFVSLPTDAISLHDVLSGDASVEEATYELTANLAAVPSGTGLESYAETKPEGLSDVVDHLRERYAYVLLDVGAGLSHETVLPLGLADAIFLVSTPDPAAVHDGAKTIDLAQRIGSFVAGVIVTRTERDDDERAREIAAKLGIDLLAAVPNDRAVRDSVFAGTPVVFYDPSSPASTVYRELASLVTTGGSSTERNNAHDDDDSTKRNRTTDQEQSTTHDSGDTESDTVAASPDDVSSAISEAESGSDPSS